MKKGFLKCLQNIAQYPTKIPSLLRAVFAKQTPIRHFCKGKIYDDQNHIKTDRFPPQ